MTCVDPDHFDVTGGVITPQPWMQMRRVATTTAKGKSGNYGVSGGRNKNDLLQSITASWTNDTPLDAWVWGEVVRGGSKVTLQARSRGGLLMQHGASATAGAITLTDASLLAVGLDKGKGGFLDVGTDFGIAEVRQPSCSLPLCPEKTGWWKLAVGETFTGRVDVRFLTSIWEGTDPDGGAAGTESTYIAGDLRLDLYAVPVFP